MVSHSMIIKRGLTLWLNPDKVKDLAKRYTAYEQTVQAWEAVASGEASDSDPVFDRLVTEVLAFPKGKALLADAVRAKDQCKKDRDLWADFEEKAEKFRAMKKFAGIDLYQTGVDVAFKEVAQAYNACKHLDEALPRVVQATLPFLTGVLEGFKVY